MSLWRSLKRALSRERRPDPYEIGEPTICECPCHDDPKMVHAVPCCRNCSTCGERFACGLAAHREQCAPSARGD